MSASPTPMDLFSRMLPVIRHPRCSNCHGGLDPRSAAHEGQEEVLTGSSCESCHLDAKDWSLPSTDHFFPGKTDRQLCAQFAEIASKMGFPNFDVKHLQGDELIQLAFVGMMGGARDSTTTTPPKLPLPPPMSHAAFVALGQDWLDKGQGACDVEGTITQEETVETDTTWHPDPTRDERHKQNWTRTVEIKLTDGQYRAHIEVRGELTIEQTTHLTNASGKPCSFTITTGLAMSSRDDGPADVRVKDTVFFADTHPELGQTDYRIDVKLHPERITETNTNSVQDNGCGMPFSASPTETMVSKSPPHEFTIEGHLEDRRIRNLTGGCDKTVKSSEVGTFRSLSESPCFRLENLGNHHRPWLMYHGAEGQYPDGTGEIPIRVVTTWNIVFRVP